jgi:hypothetical protein
MLTKKCAYGNIFYSLIWQNFTAAIVTACLTTKNTTDKIYHVTFDMLQKNIKKKSGNGVRIK